jgi:hypothetical protein
MFSFSLGGGRRWVNLIIIENLLVPSSPLFEIVFKLHLLQIIISYVLAGDFFRYTYNIYRSIDIKNITIYPRPSSMLHHHFHFSFCIFPSGGEMAYFSSSVLHL